MRKGIVCLALIVYGMAAFIGCSKEKKDLDPMRNNQVEPKETPTPTEPTEIEPNHTMIATNPLIWSDVPDPDVIRVGDYYYMVSTTMHLSPGAPIMRSTDLSNWEIVSYVYEELSDQDSYQLKNDKEVYGNGQWATSIRYHQGIFYICFASLDQGTTYIYRTDNIETGTWTKNILPGWHHDPSLLFDDDGMIYLVYGGGKIRIKELNSDLTGFVQGGVDQVLVDTVTGPIVVNAEGAHFYKINGSYYLFLIEWPASGTSRRIEWCYRSETLLGDYQGKVILDDNFYYGNNGVAQGGIFDTPDGDWYGMVFQDHGAVGRIPMLVPVIWDDGWPMMGVNGKVPLTIEVKGIPMKATNIVENDEFEYEENRLKLQWQWNHNPDHSLWSLIERPGYLRLKTGTVVANILQARNSLSQRSMGPISSYETKLDTSAMQPGDYAGIAAFQNTYGMAGVKMDSSGQRYLMVYSNSGNGDPIEEELIPLHQEEVHLKLVFFFDVGEVKRLTTMDKAYFYYSLDGKEWTQFKYTLTMKYTLDHFMGYRPTLYNYATTESGGYVDFDYYRYRNGIN